MQITLFNTAKVTSTTVIGPAPLLADNGMTNLCGVVYASPVSRSWPLQVGPGVRRWPANRMNWNINTRLVCTQYIIGMLTRELWEQGIKLWIHPVLSQTRNLFLSKDRGDKNFIAAVKKINVRKWACICSQNLQFFFENNDNNKGFDMVNMPKKSF